LASSKENSSGFELEVDSHDNRNNKSIIPYWVDEDYSYDPANPQKPNMCELIETLSGKKLRNFMLT
jgi:hypothetical protein